MTREIKADGVKLVRAGGRTSHQTRRELDLPQTALRGWSAGLRSQSERPGLSASGRGVLTPLSPKLHQQLGQPADYVRQAGFDPIQQEQMVLQYVQAHAKITRKDVSSLCRISDDQAYRLLHKLVKKNQLQLIGVGPGSAYVLP